MRLTFLDIETYKELFCCNCISFDSDTHEELDRISLQSADNFAIDVTLVSRLQEYLAKADYFITFNGSRFDLPILAKIKRDCERMGYTTSKFVHIDANNLISYDDNNHSFGKLFCQVREWNCKHFDLLNNCLLSKSLKQWEMYCNLPIRELPYPPDAALTPEMKKEIVEYCFHDVWATAQVFWRFGSGEQKTKYHTLRARKAIMDSMYPKHLPLKFDKTPQAVAASIIYQSAEPIPPVTIDPLELFNLEEFDVPAEVKAIIRLLAASHPVTEKEKTALAAQCVYRGIQFGKGGCHYIKKGKHKGIFAFDVQSEYPRVIRRWNLLKTPQARQNWSDCMEKRFAMKAKKGTPEYMPDLDNGMKILVLNALSGGFRIRTGSSVAFDPAAGEAMCYIGQLVVTELALACPNWDDVIEINTDSVFVVGEENAKALREKCEQMLVKYDMLFEEEYMDMAYFRDVNNYGIYDKEGNLLDGRGLDYSDAINKNHEIAVIKEMFKNLVRDELDLDFSKYDWKDFIYKYHKSSASKYAAFNGEPFIHKNYYFLWTTRECPDAGTVQFSNTLMDTKNGSIKSRYGVFAFDIADLEKYKDYIDFRQYQRDLDENFWNWDRKDLIRTFLGDTKERKARGIKSPKSLKEISQFLFPWTTPVEG